MSEPVRLMVGPEQSDNVRFGVLMEEIRNERGFSRARAAQILHLTSEFIRLIEKGKRIPAAGTTRYILETYGVPFETDLAGGFPILMFKEYRVEFTSRIKAARSKGKPSPTFVDRDKRIGQIVRLLAIADDKMLHDIHRKLRRENR